MYKQYFYIIHLPIIVVLCFFILSGCASTSETETISPTSDAAHFWIHPPLVFVNNILYKRVEEVTNEASDDNSFYLGEITSKVSSDQSPTEDFQSNTEIVGAKIYQSGDDLIVVYEENYSLYRILDE
jgi:hypothetical protein